MARVVAFLKSVDNPLWSLLKSMAPSEQDDICTSIYS